METKSTAREQTGESHLNDTADTAYLANVSQVILGLRLGKSLTSSCGIGAKIIIESNFLSRSPTDAICSHNAIKL